MASPAGRRGITFDAVAAAAGALGVPPRALASAAAQEAFDACWAGLADAERAVLAALAELGGAAPAAVVRDEGADLLADGDDLAPHRAAADAAITSLWESGLLARERETRDLFLVSALHDLVTPRAIGARLARLVPLPAPAHALVDDHLVACAVGALRHEPVRVTRDGTPYKRSLEAFAERLAPLLEGSTSRSLVRAESLLAHLARLGLTEKREDAWVASTAAARAWAARGPVARASHALCGSSDAAALAACPAAALLGEMWREAPEHAWPAAEWRRTLRRAAFRSGLERSPDFRIRSAALDDAARSLVDAGLAAPWRPEGAGARSAALLALTPLGAALASGTDVHHAPAPFHVGHDLAVLVPRGVPPAVHLRLGEVARLESADNVARYRLDREVLLGALDAGAACEEIEAFLAEHAVPGLPPAVRDDLRRWSERFGEVSSHGGIAVACRVAGRAEEFGAVVARSGTGARVIAPGVAVVAPRDHAALLDALVGAGFTARRSVIPPDEVRAEAPAGAAGDGRQADEPEGELLAAFARAGAAPPSVAEATRLASPPPAQVTRQIKEKYRREFGSGQLAALDDVDLDELLSMEEKGLVRRFLSSRADAPLPSGLRDVDRYESADLVAVTPTRARQVLEHALAAGTRCQVAWLARPGRTARMVVEPIDVVADATGTWLRARTPSSDHERMIAIDRISAIRLIP